MRTHTINTARQINMNEIELKQSLFLVMGSLFHDARRYLDKQFKSYGLPRNEWLILALLRTNPAGITQTYAKSYIGIEMSYFTKVLNGLEKKKFIIREVDSKDRRNRIIKLNPKAPVEIKKIFDTIYDLNNKIQCDLNKKQMQELHKSLSAIHKRLEPFKQSI